MDADARQLLEDVGDELDRLAVSPRPQDAIARILSALAAALTSARPNDPSWRTFYREARALLEWLDAHGTTVPSLHTFVRENADLDAGRVREPALT